MATYKPMLIFLVTLISIFLFSNLIISPIYQIENIQPSGISGIFINTIEDGWSFDLPFIGNSTIKPISWFYLGNSGVEDFIVTQLTYLSIIPNLILVPIILILIGSLGWSIIIIIKDIIPFT